MAAVPALRRPEPLHFASPQGRNGSSSAFTRGAGHTRFDVKQLPVEERCANEYAIAPRASIHGLAALGHSRPSLQRRRNAQASSGPEWTPDRKHRRGKQSNDQTKADDQSRAGPPHEGEYGRSHSEGTKHVGLAGKGTAGVGRDLQRRKRCLCYDCAPSGGIVCFTDGRAIWRSKYPDNVFDAPITFPASGVFFR